jgi:hypothetical protein
MNYSVERETLQISLYLPRALSSVGSRQGSMLSENVATRAEKVLCVLDYVVTQSSVAVQPVFGPSTERARR